MSYCTFCEIVARRLPSRVRYEDDEVLVFDNQLDWVPVMLLLIPKAHMTQAEMWSSGPLMAKLGALAVRLGQERCPNGFRVLSNFGHDALQTQPHGHLHVIGGTHLGLYVRRPGFGL
jgi:histidine triad (HIT) family protein